jgi:putative salt-induced outer membrane protein YdiY
MVGSTHKIIGWAWLIVGLSFSSQAIAQVNAEPLRSLKSSGEDEDGLSGLVDVSLSGTTGNVNSVALVSSGFVRAREKRHMAFLFGKAEYTEFGSDVRIARSYVHGRYNYQLLKRWWAEAYGQIQQDKIRRLRLRELVGVGPRFGLVDEDNVEMFLATSYMLEFERINVEGGQPDEPEVLAHRSSSYVAITWQLDKTLQFNNTIYIQPRLDRWGDLRILNEGSLIIKITNRLQTKITSSMRYDSEPPSGVKNTDFSVANALSLTF